MDLERRVALLDLVAARLQVAQLLERVARVADQLADENLKQSVRPCARTGFPLGPPKHPCALVRFKPNRKGLLSGKQKSTVNSRSVPLQTVKAGGLSYGKWGTEGQVFPQSTCLQCFVDHLQRQHKNCRSPFGRSCCKIKKSKGNKLWRKTPEFNPRTRRVKLEMTAQWTGGASGGRRQHRGQQRSPAAGSAAQPAGRDGSPEAPMTPAAVPQTRMCRVIIMHASSPLVWI